MELNNLNWGIYNTYVNFEICILTAQNVEKRKENIRNMFFNFATRPSVQVLQASQKYYTLNSQETNEFIGENNFFSGKMCSTACQAQKQPLANVLQNRCSHGLLNTRPSMSHSKAKIKRPVFQKNSTK